METKICTKCGRELPLDQFNWRDKAKGTRRADCKQCHSGYMKAKYQEKKETIQDIKAELKCQKCGYDKCAEALDFHHINPEEKEKFNFSFGVCIKSAAMNLSDALKHADKHMYCMKSWKKNK